MKPRLLFLGLVLWFTLGAGPAPTGSSAVFLTFESGILAGVDWVETTNAEIHTRSIMNRSLILDATIHVRDDGTASGASASVSRAGEPPGAPNERTFEGGTVPWSDYIPSSVELAVRRARALGTPTARIPAASLFSAARGTIEVERVDATDWVVSYHNKRYEAATNERGDLLAATLPDYGVTIERRDRFAPDRYPIWPANEAPPDGAYRAIEVRIPCPQGHVLAGTLTLPRRFREGGKRVPGAVLITGLSPNNRNNGDPPWMPLRDVADELTRRGIAVLRVDDRGVGQSTGNHDSSTTFDEANDVAAEVAWLRAHGGIDPKRIALVGYSEGGLIAPMVASRDPSIAAIVTMAGPGVPGPELARYQIGAQVLADTTIAPSRREAEIEKQLAEPMTPREREFLPIDPLSYARRVRCPALILQGGCDRHVPIRSAERLAEAMRSSGNQDVTVRIFPGVSHNFVHDPVGLVSGWAMLPALNLAPEVLEGVGVWAETHLDPGRTAAAR